MSEPLFYAEPWRRGRGERERERETEAPAAGQVLAIPFFELQAMGMQLV